MTSFKYQGETEISLSHVMRMSLSAMRARVLGSANPGVDAAAADDHGAGLADAADYAEHDERRNPCENGPMAPESVSVSSLGSVGRFGNQLFQYMFARAVARREGTGVNAPEWVVCRHRLAFFFFFFFFFFPAAHHFFFFFFFASHMSFFFFFFFFFFASRTRACALFLPCIVYILL
jgi:hypothetical protein